MAGSVEDPEHDGSALPWIYGIARNVCRNSDRSARRFTLALHRLSRDDGATSGDELAEDVAQRVDSERQMAAVRAAIATLSRHDRDVLELVAWAGLSYQAAAIALNIPVGTVRSRLSRARHRLTEIVEKENP